MLPSPLEIAYTFLTRTPIHASAEKTTFSAAPEDPGVPREREGPEPGGGEDELHPGLAEPPRVRRQPLRCQVVPTCLPDLSVHCCYVHVCFFQVTTCGAPDALTRLGARIFQLLSHLLGSQNKYR